MKVLVAGGAGYIGSHMVSRLLNCGHEVQVVDNLSTGFRLAIKSENFVKCDIADTDAIMGILRSFKPDAVVHFASFIQVGESVREPARYYANNVRATLSLLDAMVANKVNKIVFSSTAAVYGDPIYVPIKESHPKNPISPYGRSKWMVEQILQDYDLAYQLNSVCLRYFNAAGADPTGMLGERHDPETHLIPLILQVASRRRSHLTVFGKDYPTLDGTCVRDYIHIDDLIDAHLLALAHLAGGNKSEAFNLGNGNGFSVNEVIETAERVTGEKIVIDYADRRIGDPPCLVADATHARKVLGWNPKFITLDKIISDAWNWEKRWPWP